MTYPTEPKANEMNTEISIGLNLETQADLKRLKMYFPYRIVFASYLDGKFETFADHTKRRMNCILRKGGLIWTF